MSDYQAPRFLTELLQAQSPSGAEAQAQAVFDAHVRPHAAAYANDAACANDALLRAGRIGIID